MARPVVPFLGLLERVGPSSRVSYRRARQSTVRAWVPSPMVRGRPATPVMPRKSRIAGATTVKIEALIEDYESGVLNAALWVFDGSYEGHPGSPSAATFDITNGVARLKPTDTIAFDSDGRFRSVGTNYSVLGSSVYGKFSVDVSNTNVEVTFALTSPANDGNFFGMMIQTGTFYQIGQDNGSLNILQSGTTYDPVAHAWWRLSVSRTGVITFDAAPDARGSPGNWTTLWTDSTSSLPWLAATDAVRLLIRRRNFAALANLQEGVFNVDGINTAIMATGVPADPLFFGNHF